MKVAYIGNFGVSFSTESHVAGSLELLGHQVLRIQEDTVDWTWVPVHAAANGVDFVLWTHTHGFAPEPFHDAQLAMLERLRQAGIPSVAFHLDKWWGLERQEQVYEPFFQCDLVVTADGGHQADWERIGVNHVWMPPAVYGPETYLGTPRREDRKDVGFVGSWREYGHADVWPWRFELVSAVWKRYGSRFRAWPRGKALRGAELNDVYASVKVIVGDSCLAGGATHYWSDRVPETIGRGGFLLHPDVPGLDDHFPAEFPVRYQVGDLRGVFDLIDYWTDPARDDERLERVRCGIEYVQTFHTYEVRMRDVVERVKRARALC